MVTLAVAGPLTQSVSLTNGNTDSAVGPGVGFRVITVQPETGKRAAWVGTAWTAVGAGWDWTVEVAVSTGREFGVEVEVACTWGRHPASSKVVRTSKLR
jgi:hypothetical protein